MTPEQENTSAQESISLEKQALERVRQVTRPYSDHREQLWRETFLLMLTRQMSRPSFMADCAVAEFDKRFSL